MWDKLSDDIIFTCGYCGRRVNPYVEYDLMGISPEDAFNNMPPCQCGYRKWEFKN